MKRLGLVPLAMIAAGLLFAAACGGETVVETVIVEKAVPGEKVVETVVVEKAVPGEKVVQTVVVEKAVPGEKVVQTVVVVATPTPAATKPPSGRGPLVLVSNDVGAPMGYPGKCPTGCYEISEFSGWQDTTMRMDAQGNIMPYLATSWELADDLSKLTFHLREGVQFHKGWGEFTADDFKFTIDTANTATNPDSTHGQGGGLATAFGDAGVTVIDPYTVELEIIQPSVDIITSRWVAYGHAMVFYSKRMTDELGVEAAKGTFVGTGAYQIETWTSQDRMVLTAFEDHWRKVPAIEEVRALYVPEAQSQIAMFLTGDAHLLKVDAQFVPELAAAGGVVKKTGQRNFEWWFTQNYLDRWDPVEKVEVKWADIPAYVRTKGVIPYVADYEAPGCDYDVITTKLPEGPVCDEIENARKVRMAMAMVVPRQAMVDEIMGGYGYPAYVNRLDSSNSQLAREEWEWPYDPEAARQLMAEAGVPDGFEHELWIGQDTPTREELAFTVVAAWEEELGIISTLDRTEYGRKKDDWAARDADSMAMCMSTTDGGLKDDMPKGYSNWTRPWLGGSNPFSRTTTTSMQEEYDKAARLQMAEDWFEHYAYWHWGGAAITEIGLRVQSPDVIWDTPYSTWIAWAWWYPLEELAWK